MSWLTNYVKPKLQKVLNSKETPDNLWHKCKNCGQMIFQKEFVANQYVCAHCDHHDRVPPTNRFDALFDNKNYELIELPSVKQDPLKFRDTKKYTDRLKSARNTTGDEDAIKVAVGKIGGQETVVAIQNFFFMGGSMGMAVGEGIIAGARHALKINAPYVMFTASGGARMQEGILSLMQMPRTTVAIQMLRDAGLPYLVVLTDPTSGGVSASYAMLGDVQIAEPGAMIAFSGPRVIEQTIREKLPDGFQRAEYLLEHGMVDMVTHRHQLPEELGKILTLLMGGRHRGLKAAE
ncbi:acetyl-CoA carboxylase, carboxyltransferase subunit beta [Kordiimonas sp. SCSIO 12610]|uniref:acetyl-CoA carboxylase, carboxyltransferase subunit beta n=1 Tax=Kordiimonas sp. SCSIO 12610 TaxID=2829597 RepID=UPI00210A0FC9|nr:acetyl-CoA carboxylase, carboxyltransferase subunit beta [Kordiimonas sp. SCSIO 12610]UTW55219.1 acetyl-CoA carboxylase carboxyltransferase subunit beta [Kordiimonas sp. SCSIO 12610]